MKFKVGDTVIRIIGEYRDMRVGNIDVVIGIRDENIELKYYGDGHSELSLDHHTRNNWREHLK